MRFNCYSPTSHSLHRKCSHLLGQIPDVMQLMFDDSIELTIPTKCPQVGERVGLAFYESRNQWKLF